MEQAAGEHRVERVVFETDRHRIVADVTLPPEGYKSRFSDLLNNPEVAFISLVDVKVSELEGGGPESHPFLALAKSHVRLAYPFDEQA